MTKTLVIAISVTKEDLKDLVRCLDPTEPWVKSDYVEELSAFLKDALANYEDEKENG